MQLPAFVEFAEPVPSLGVEAGDRAWVTQYSATLVRTLEVSQVRPHLHLAKTPEPRVREANDG